MGMYCKSFISINYTFSQQTQQNIQPFKKDKSQVYKVSAHA